ncbi:hypothetical protein [Haloarcula sp. JP-L23]|uniref:hypothetical protein n=1 Tax=Haloarcula sp. JP-L23 TaxID=2716717 RepID=UPI00140EC833|nr:hypothetical protein G9465_12260 [Haloarcula sp. JP-L23]
MAEKTIKTDELVHEQLQALKSKYGVDTFNDVLRLELEIDPGTDIEKLSAFLNEQLRDDLDKVLRDIEDIANFERGYNRRNKKDILTFEVADTRRKIAEIRFRKGEFFLYYRGNNGEMERCVRCYESGDDGVSYFIADQDSDSNELEDARESVIKNVQQAYQRWK